MAGPTPANEMDAWLAKLEPTLSAHLDGAGEAPADTAPDRAAQFNAPRDYADSKRVRVTLVPVNDNDPNLPPVKNLVLPPIYSGSDAVEISDGGAGGKKATMKRSEALESPDYVDNGIQTLKAQPTLATLEVKEMELIYSNGRNLTVKMGWVKFGTNPLTTTFVRKDRFIIPVNGKNVLFDANNTPNIFSCAEYVKQQMRQRSEERVEMAELVVAFSAAMAALGGAAAGAREITGGGAGGHGAGSEDGGGVGGGKRGKVGQGGEDTGGGGGGKGGGGDGGKGGSSSGTSHGGGTPSSHEAPTGGGGGTNKPAGGKPQPKTNLGTADTPVAPPPKRPEGATLDTNAGKRPGGETVDTDSPKGGSQKGGGKNQPTPGKRHPLDLPPLPLDHQKISIKTPGGTQEMTVGEYRKRWHAANDWLGNETTKLNEQHGVSVEGVPLHQRKNWSSKPRSSSDSMIIGSPWPIPTSTAASKRFGSR